MGLGAKCDFMDWEKWYNGYVKELSKRNPKEAEKYASQQFLKNMRMLKKQFEIKLIYGEALLNQQNALDLQNKAIEFYRDLESEGLLTIDPHVFDLDTEKGFKMGQIRDKIANKYIQLTSVKTNKEKTDLLCEIYANIYEDFGNSTIKELAKLITGSEHSIWKALTSVRSYKKGKYFSLFVEFDNHIRNSIQHTDYYINKLEPEIIFEDKIAKVTIKKSTLELERMINRMTLIVIAFENAKWKLKGLGMKEIFEAIEYLSNYVEKHGKKVVFDPLKSNRNLIELYKELKAQNH